MQTGNGTRYRLGMRLGTDWEWDWVQTWNKTKYRLVLITSSTGLLCYSGNTGRQECLQAGSRVGFMETPTFLAINVL